MNQIRHNIFDTDEPKARIASLETHMSVGSRCEILEDSDDLRAIQQGWKQITGDSCNQHQNSTKGYGRQPSIACETLTRPGCPFLVETISCWGNN